MITLYIIASILGLTLAMISHIHSKKTTKIDQYDESAEIAGSLLILVLPSIIVTIMLVITSIFIINFVQSKEIKTPKQYIHQQYYIDNSNQIYVKTNGIYQKSQIENNNPNIEYGETIKQPSVEFKTTKTLTTNMSNWIPFYFQSKTKTSISRIILPKSALTEKLTKVDVVNQAQSDSSDLSLSN